MNAAPRTPWPSEAPLVSERVSVGDGQALLVRRIDPLFDADERALALFSAEVTAGAAVRGLHPALLGTSETASNDRELARPFSPHGTLASWPVVSLEAPLIASWISWLADALGAMHEAGLAHGDPSPRNIVLFSERGTPRLADPASARRAFALGGVDDARERDRAVAIRFLERLLDGAPSRGEWDEQPTLRSELQRVRYCNLSPAGKLDALRRLGGGLPPPEMPPRAAAAEPEPSVRVLLVAGPFADPGDRENVRRAMMPYALQTGADLRQAAGSDRVAAEVDWPEPARALAAGIRGTRVPVLIGARVGGRIPRALLRDGGAA